MKFRPINDDHAIELVSFSVRTDRVVEVSDIQALIAAHDHIRLDLPAVQLSDPPEPIIEFSFQLPNGEAAWLLRVGGGNLVEVECRHYTRWDKVWRKAYAFMRHALLVLNQDRKPPIEVGNATLNVTDRFACVDVDADRSELLQRSELIAEIAFKKSDGAVAPLFHSNVGWFETLGEDHVLNTLHVYGRYDQRFDPNQKKTRPMPFVVVEHQQQLRQQEGIQLNDALENSLIGIDNVMQTLHLRNKEILNRVLVDEMRKKIGLQGQK